MKYINSDVTVIGAGASGLMAGICFLRELKKQKKFKRIILLDHMDRVGKKILVTGNGRCNLTNRNIDLRSYHSNHLEIAKNILDKFDYSATIKFFNSIGLEIVEDSLGHIYPRSNQASSVLDLMRLEFKTLGGDEIINFKTKSIKKQGLMFKISSEEKVINSSKVIISTGGLTNISQGCDGSGYLYLKKFGHEFIKTFPSLTQIKVSDKIVKSLKGMRTFCNISVVADGKKLKEEQGELQFTDIGLSGICTFQISRMVSEFTLFGTINNRKYNSIKISVDLFPELKYEDVISFINKRILLHPNMTLENFFIGVLNKRIGQALVKTCNFSLCKKVSDLSNEEILFLSKKLKFWEFSPISAMGYKNAQVTAGGIDLFGFNKDTLESKKIKNLYACGEVLDVDGDCGGFNLQWAWSSGYVAGLNASMEI